MAEASGKTMMLLVVFLAIGGLSASAAPTLQTNITSLTSNSQAVIVSAINVTSPAANDAIALVIPANTTNYTATPPQKFKWIQSDSGYLSSGTGSVTFQIYNSHSDFKFILARNVQEWSTGNFTVAAETSAIPIANPQLPGQIHLLLTNITGQVAVQWTTLQQAAGAVVQYGTTSGQYTGSANATFDTYTASQMCGGEAATTGYLFPGVFNNALMTNLSASTQYFYRVGNQVSNFSAEYNFTTAPVDGQGPVQFLAIADLGYCETDSSLEWESDYPNPITYTPPGTLAALKVEFDNAWEGNWLSFCAAREVANAMIADPNKGTLLVHNGDISYAQGFTYGWDVYWDMMQPLLSHIPYMAVQGNHERDWPGTGDRYLQENAKDSGGECGVVFEKRIPMPIPHPGQQWYTFTYGPIFFIQFSTEIDFGEGSAQHDFIYKALSSVNRTTFPWLVVGFHRPYLEPSVYGPNNKADIQNQQDLQAAFDDIFFQYQVDMTWFGHTHWYSRSCPVYKKQCQPPASDGSQTAPVHVNIGNAGASFSWDVVDPAVLTQDIYSASAIQHGYLRVNASRTSLHIQAVNSLDGTLLDDYTLTKPAGWAANSTRQTATMTNFVGNFTSTWYETYGTVRTQAALSTQGQAAAAQTNRGKVAPQQAAAQEVTQPGVAADAGAKQGKKRGGKKQAQKAAEPVNQGSSENLAPTYPPQASWDPASGHLHHTEGPPMQLPLPKSQFDYQPEQHEQPREHHSKLKQSHIHSHAHQHSQSGRQQQNADYFNGPQAHAQPDYHKHQPQAESRYPLHAQHPMSSEGNTQNLPQQPSQPARGARQPPPGFPALPPKAPAKPTPQDLHFPPLHQAVATANNRKQSRGRADARPTQHQSQQQPPQQLPAQQHGDAPGGNQTYSFADLQRANQELQQLQQQQPMAGDNSRQMAQMMQMQMQQQKMMMSMMAQQQQQGGNAPPALAAQPAVTPTWNQPAFPLNQALPSNFPSVGPNPPSSAYRSDQYQSSGMQPQDRPRRPETRPPRRLIKGLTENELRNFTCPITHDIMWEPVLASDGHTYEKDAIEQWLAASPDGQALSPMTQLPMGRTVLPNKIIADLIRDKQAKV